MNNTELNSRINELKSYIKDSLKDYPNFIDVDINSITPIEEDSLLVIQGKNKQVHGFYYGEDIKFYKSQLTSTKAIQNIADKFIKDWKDLDNPEAIEQYKSFLEQGETYGWD